MHKVTLSLYDSRQHQIIPFVALDPYHVRLYFCGPTVYDFLHIGNLRAMLTADILVRLLRLLYPTVTYVRNITDVDDKINARAKLNNESIQSLTQRTTADFHQDMQSMYILPPDVEPRATEHIADIIQMISQLIEKKHAYEAQGHVLFSVSSYRHYGSLSGRNPDELLAGARVEVATYKKDPGDFVLWKPSTDQEPGWDSPWGRGRPGWHIECSAMSYRYLGENFDIHGGGHDLLFPHHENECAQSICCFPNSKFANIWVHNAMLLVDGEKMSKSLGNFFTIREILEQHNPEAIRFALLQAHYRSVLNFSQSGLKEAKQIMDRFYRALLAFEQDLNQNVDLPQTFLEAMLDDLNTPKALTVMHQLADYALKGNKEAALQLRSAGQQLGLFNVSPTQWFQNTDKAQEIKTLIDQRDAAKKAKDYALADQIRNQLKEQGIILEDSPNGTTWRQI
ncbi:cysteine--tRNA ligase [Commensalibacter oyaizuii]|uniref:Cysteine--tRNA ligase n=1 Tax=Commensalibacter oyaizuii TaxID=3043873 RepID=A0ABT6PZC4_9PROT|nr:cysteine--tRNA ligase [Commensalibacter sp. TBRC 16381]MDI2090212.1 cysteine--tRNA ligase [Commensalibacter sp. TBRC 16381]